jgi:ATP-binding cassette subfamily B protein IrtB
MTNMIKRLLKFSGGKRNDLIASFVFSLLDSVFEMLPIMAILTVLSGLLTVAEGGVMAASTIWASLGIMVISIAGRIFFNNLSCVKRTLGSFAMCAQKRLEIGEHMKRVPMGYFSENRLGEIAAAATTTLGDIENNAVLVLERVAGGFIHAIVIGVWLLFYEWRIGLLMFAGLAVSMLVYAGIQRSAKRLSPRRQAAQASLVTCFLEYIQGMGVVKAFGLGERSGKAVNEAICESAKANILLESTFSALTGVYQTVFKLSRSAILVVAPYLLLGGEITPVKCLLLLVSSFMIYSSVELVGSMASVARVIDASLDRLDAVMDTPVLDEHGSDIAPKHFDIELQNVSFAYGKEDVLHDITITIPEKTSCAVVGPSGSGKTTLVSLIARFWDVREGKISLGGHDVRDYTCDSLLKNFSIVFQRVYLFEDTIENNIRFGCPNASHEQVVAAAQKACCHDFISALPEGYRTKVGEGGASLSGGEKQRISIARAILKDAPIIILDEATASVDPENERELQSAISALTKDKTIIMIAHRLSTVRNADQIIVLDEGRIVQRGTHRELMKQDGLYRRFVDIREQAIGWRLEGETHG